MMDSMMPQSTPKTEKVLVTLEDNTPIYVEVQQAGGGREDVANRSLPFEDVSSALEGIVKAVAKPINAAMPTKASVEFGLEIEVHNGHLIAALVRSTGTANLKITLEWEKEKEEKK